MGGRVEGAKISLYAVIFTDKDTVLHSLTCVVDLPAVACEI